jgi:recombinational DNA repair protein (RecF pathway)
VSDRCQCAGCGRQFSPRNVELANSGPICLLCASGRDVEFQRPASMLRLVLAAAGELPTDASPADLLVHTTATRLLAQVEARERLVAASAAEFPGRVA